MNHGGMAVALVGPTASGKSALAHHVARERADTEVLSVDAMTVYRGMDLGTAKPSVRERAEVRYHLLDLVDPADEFTLAQFQSHARTALDEVWLDGAAALYVGGTGLYGRAVLDDLEIPGQFPEVRSALETRAASSLLELYEQLRSLDPVAASRMEPANARRVVRALEVCLGSGRTFSSYGDGLLRYGPVHVVQIGLDVELDELDARIERRFYEWMDQGLLEEVARLANAPRGLGRTARQAVGYRQLLAHVEQGVALEDCVSDALRQSRRLARRQRSWFRRDPRVEWFSDLDQARRRLFEVLSSPDGFVRD